MQRSFEEISTAELDSAWGAEIERRIDELDSGSVQAVPLEEVLARMDARLKQRLQK
jgi:putative addiction module component (TIGR02574 family)